MDMRLNQMKAPRPGKPRAPNLELALFRRDRPGESSPDRREGLDFLDPGFSVVWTLATRTGRARRGAAAEGGRADGRSPRQDTLFGQSAAKEAAMFGAASPAPPFCSRVSGVFGLHYFNFSFSNLLQVVLIVIET